ncbi:MAG: LTA synthase family protein [Tissierellia bacterium]|nr:LTA synthase family protein [Tissierellia bacterium]
MLKFNNTNTEKLEKILTKPFVLELIFILGTIFSIFTKSIYLQYTIKLKEPPFSLLNYISVYIFLTSCILVFFVALWAPKRFKGVLLGLNILISVLLFSDTLYGRYYGIPLTIPILYQVGFVNDIAQSIFSLLKIKDIVFFIDIPVIIIFIYFIKNIRVKTNPKLILIRSIAILLSLVLGISVFNITTKRIDRSRHVYQRKNIAQDLGTIYFHGFDIYDFVKQRIIRNKPLTDDEIITLKEFYQSRGSEKSSYYGIAADKNLIVVQVEAMQEFVVGLNIEGQEVTPFLNKLKNNSFYFNNIYHQVAGGNTSDAEFMLNNSMYPTITGAVNYLYPTNDFLSLGKVMKDLGYVSYAFHGYESSFWNREAVYRNYNYDKYFSMNDFELNEKRGWAISDESFFKQSLDISLKNDKFFSFLITLSSHHPYDAFGDIDLYTGEFEGTQVGNYLKSMRYVDTAIESLFKELEERGQLENTLIVIYGDHSGLYQDQRGLTEALLGLDGSSIAWNKIQKVPVWIYTGSELEGRTIEKAGGQIDILPTILDLMGIHHPYVMGKSLLLDGPGYCVKWDGSVIFDNYYYNNQERVLYDNNNQPIEDEGIISEARAKQEELKVSDIILKKNLMKNGRLSEILE